MDIEIHTLPRGDKGLETLVRTFLNNFDLKPAFSGWGADTAKTELVADYRDDAVQLQLLEPAAVGSIAPSPVRSDSSSRIVGVYPPDVVVAQIGNTRYILRTESAARSAVYSTAQEAAR